MSIYLDVVCTEPRIGLLERREQTVRAIAEILPFVLGKYGIGRKEVPQELPDGYDYSI